MSVVGSFGALRSKRDLRKPQGEDDGGFKLAYPIPLQAGEHAYGNGDHENFQNDPKDNYGHPADILSHMESVHALMWWKERQKVNLLSHRTAARSDPIVTANRSQMRS